MKVITIERAYRKNVVTSRVLKDGQFVCFAFELPWRNNQRQISCIPEGTYMAVKQKKQGLGDILRLSSVPGRSGVLVHVANSTKEILGCIAPVTSLDLSRPGGNESRAAVASLLAGIRDGEMVQIVVRPLPDKYHETGVYRP